MLVFVSAITLTDCHDLNLSMLSAHKSNLFKIIINGCHGGGRAAYPFGAHEFTPVFKWDSCCSIFSFLHSVC